MRATRSPFPPIADHAFNFPQAFSDLALIEAAMRIISAEQALEDLQQPRRPAVTPRLPWGGRPQQRTQGVSAPRWR